MTIGLHFGALCKPIDEQLNAQGFALSKMDSERFQKNADAITRLHLNHLIPDSVRDTAHKKLMKQICSCETLCEDTQ